jgi:uncharacterized protein (DUF1800 family)
MADFLEREHLLLAINRLGYGPRAEDYSSLMRLKVGGWLEEQLSAPSGDDPAVTERLNQITLRIKYEASENRWQSVDELRHLSNLSKPIDELWLNLFDQQKPVSGQERGFPRNETIAATMIRAVYSRYQLREVITQFWHDHFHVNAFSDDHIAVSLPCYDRDVIRKHCFGNFREMLEAVATSTAMQYYLSNHSSRAGAANENYARELFELHTFGREAYLNDRYDRWREVPGALSGRPSGYIDQDVYEAARAFTGWTIEDGAQIDGGRKLPATGKFAYVENWHDGYQKRVLATEFDPFSSSMADGRKVLDLIAKHPATSLHMATKLCRRMIGPAAPVSITKRAADAWTKLVHEPNQIAQIVRLIAESPEFAQSRGNKVKRPLAVMANYARIMGYDFTPTEGLFNQLSNAGQRLFGASTPAGLPDDNAIFIGSSAMRNRWQLILGLAQNSWNNGVPQPRETLRAWGKKMDSGKEVMAQWFDMFGITARADLISESSMAAGLVPFAVPANDSDGDKKLSMASAIAAMAPEFQSC